MIGDGIHSLLELLGLGPIWLATKKIQDKFHVVSEEVQNVERTCGYFFVVVVNKYFRGETDLICFFCVFAHEEDKGDDGANQTTNVGKIRINFIELSSVFDDIGRFFESDG